MMTFQMLLFYIPMVCLKIRDVIVFTDFAAATKKSKKKQLVPSTMQLIALERSAS